VWQSLVGFDCVEDGVWVCRVEEIQVFSRAAANAKRGRSSPNTQNLAHELRKHRFIVSGESTQ
jgi:hypothetical protein